MEGKQDDGQSVHAHATPEKYPTAIWVPKCCKFFANILVSILSTFVAARFRRSSRNLEVLLRVWQSFAKPQLFLGLHK